MWRKDFENIKTGLCLVSYENETCLAYRQSLKRKKSVNLYYPTEHSWIYEVLFEHIDAWMELPKPIIKKQEKV